MNGSDADNKVNLDRIGEAVASVDGRVFEVFAPAKINLRLKVEGRRSDGYHLLSMLNTNLSLGDSLFMSFSKEPSFHLSVEPAEAIPAGGENLIVKAFRSFWRVFGFNEPPCGLQCRLIKRIPVGGGLGGGSADAGGMFRCLTEVFGEAIRQARGLSQDRFHQMILDAALQCGADVPYSVVGGACWVSGIGEVVKPLPAGLSWRGKVLIMVPREPVPTAAFYERYRSTFPVLPEAPDLAMQRITQDGVFNLPELVENDFEATAAEMVPLVKAGLAEARRVFPQGTALTGSGSVFFSLVPPGQEGNARIVQDKVANLGISAHLCSIV